MSKKYMKTLSAFFILLVALLLVNVGQSIAADASNPSPSDGATGVSVNAPLSVNVGNINGTATATFYGREVGGATGEEFTFVALPDTQYLSDNANNHVIFGLQTDWIINGPHSLNIKHVSHLGDVVQNWNNTTEWDRATQHLVALEQNEIAFGIAPGNHDISTSNPDTTLLYDSYIPITRYGGYDWAGGYLGDGQYDDQSKDRFWKDNYQIFQAGGMDFIVISIEFGWPQYSIDWADALLDAYPNHRAILTTHSFLNDATGQRPTSGQFRSDAVAASVVWDTLIKDHCNVFMVLSAHFHDGDGENQLTSINDCGDSVHQLVSDYQEHPTTANGNGTVADSNGGDGKLRYMTFDPVTDNIDVFTYSPHTGNYETDTDSQFSLSYDMDSGPPAWTVIESDVSVLGGTASATWNGLDTNTEYEWYVELTDNDGASTTDSAIFSFTTELPAAPAAPANLAANVVGSSQIDLSWTDNTTTEDNYLIYQGSSGSLSEIASIAADSTSYSATGLSGSTEYCFEVYASNAGGDTPSGSEVCATTDAQPDWVAYIDTNDRGTASDSKVLSLSSDDITGNTGLVYTLRNFNDNGNDIAGVQVVVDAAGLSNSPIGATSTAGDAFDIFDGIVNGDGSYEIETTESFDMTFTGLDTDRKYTLMVTANRNESDYNESGNGTRATTFELSGYDAFTNESSVGVYDMNGAGDQITIVTGDNTTAGHVAKWTGIDPTGNQIVVSSLFHNGDDGSSKSYAVSSAMLLIEADPNAAPSTPSLTVDVVDETSLNVSWNSVANAESYELMVDGVSQFAATSPYAATGLTTDTEYCYQVRALNTTNGNSAWSTPPTCATPVVAPPWIAYNDTGYVSGQVSTNITTFTSPAGDHTGLASSGELVNYADGVGTGVTLMISGGTYNSATSGAGNGGQGNSSMTGDALAIFGGIVDPMGTISYADNDLVFTFTGLDPAKTYSVVHYANRDNGYGWERAALATIGGADSWTNNSTAGVDDEDANVIRGTNDVSTRYSADEQTTGNVLGWVVRFDDIAPGTDGEFTLTMSEDTTGSGTNGRYSNAIMLALESDPNAPPAIPVLSVDVVDETSLAVSWGSVANAESYQLMVDSGTPFAATSPYAATGLTTGIEYCYQVRALNAANGNSAWSAQTCATPAALPTLISVPVSLGSDDAEEEVVDTTMTLDSSDLEMVIELSDVQSVGIRFQNVTIPAGATITSASIEFQAKDDDSDALTLAITGQAVVNPDTFTSTNSNITGRIRTSSVVTWEPGAWTEGTKYQTVDISPILIEIIGLAGWSSGNPMTFFIDGTDGVRNAESFEGDYAPRLIVEYSTSTGPSAPSVPTGLTVDVVSDTELLVSWNDVSGEDTYELEVGPSGGGYTAVAGSPFVADTTSFNATGLTTGTEYCYVIQATNAAGASGFSSEVCATPVVTVTFQDGVDGYTGTRDTYIWDDEPDVDHGTEDRMVQDINTSDERRSLLLFDLSSIPVGSTISSAEVQFYVDAEGQGFNMHRMLLPWAESDTFNSIGGAHFEADNSDAESAVDANWPVDDGYTGYITVSIPASTIQDWIDGIQTNNGWLMIATHASDGQQLRTREHDNVDDRPKLTVAYSLPRVWDGGGGDNNWSTAANWVGDVAPTPTSIVLFTDLSTALSIKDATVDIPSVAGVIIDSGYTGSIDFSSPLAVSGSYLQNGGTVVVDPALAFTVNGRFIHRGGTLEETQVVNNDTVNFLQIQTSPTGGTDVYRGVDLTTSSDLGDVTVSVKAVNLVDEFCTSISEDDYAGRCFDITPDASAAATVTLWAPTSEIPANPQVYHYSGGVWQALTSPSSGTAGNYTWVRGNTTSFSPFLIGDAADGPTAVSLQSFSGDNGGSWQLVILCTLLGMGTAVLLFHRVVKRRLIPIKAE